jgi:3-hydroxyacyl-CoA dehydrogenase
MTNPVTLSLDGTVAVIRIDNPPVNALSPHTIDGLSAALAQAEADPAATAIVVHAAGRTFIAGADIKGLENVVWGGDSGAPEMHDLLQRIEQCGKPVVMAIHGTALGGGLEVAMAAQYRVAVADAQLGLPEVNLGIIPGAEGTQRLPRLVGVDTALTMIVSGRPVKAAEALQSGLIDRIVDDLIPGAVAFAREKAAGTDGSVGPHPKTSQRTDKLPAASDLPAMVAAAQALARKVRRHQHAPIAAIAAVEAAATLPFDEGCRKERDLFFELIKSGQARAMIYAFFAERAVAKVPGIPKDLPVAPVSRVAIVGAGTMGSGIAMACANAGIGVVLTDTEQAGLDRAMATIRKNYDSSVKKGRFTPEAAAERIGRITAQVGQAGFDQADVIIEAVFESMALKKDVLAQLDAAARPGALLATNTSTLDIDALAAVTKRPQAVIGTHFFSPANVMRLVEIVRGAATAPETVAAAQALAKRLGKVGVVVGNCPGFVGNRMMFPYMYEAQFLAEDGATPAQVDRALTDWGMAMGIFAVDDMGGLDVAWRVRQELNQFSDPTQRKPLVADQLVAMNHLGQKTGSGWYIYDAERKATPDPDVEALIERTATAAGIVRRTFTSEEIIERTIYALVNEGARILEEGFALRAADIDVIYLTGYGFPSFRGGPMFYADAVGLTHVYERVAAFHAEHGERWRPAPLLERLARENSTFRAFDQSRAAAAATT